MPDLQHFALTRRHFLSIGSITTVALLSGIGSIAAQEATPMASPIAAGRDWRSEDWVGTWAAAPNIPGEGIEDFLSSQIFTFDDQTLRQIVRISAGGDQVRIRLSNVFGTEPIAIGGASVALLNDTGAFDADSQQPLTFSGLPGVAIPPGALVLSDPTPLETPSLAELAISLFFPESTTGSTVHGFAMQTNQVSSAGDFTADADMPVAQEIQTWVFLTGVDVAVSEPTNVVVALGDSITDGAGSTPDTNRRWPDRLAERLAETAEEGAVAVLNQGIGGNRLLHDGTDDFTFAGPGALARFDRDVLAQAGVTHLIVFEGINDIGLPVMLGDDAESVSADEMIAALRQIAERGHEAGLIVLGATITPYVGAMYYLPAGEATRQAVNAWIRDGGAFDGVIDFDAVVRDPENPGRILAAFDAGDALHINDDGYAAMAGSIDLALLRD